MWSQIIVKGNTHTHTHTHTNTHTHTHTLIARDLLLVTHYSSLIARYLLLVTHYSSIPPAYFYNLLSSNIAAQFLLSINAAHHP